MAIRTMTILLAGLLAGSSSVVSAQAPRNMSELTLRDGVYVDIRTLEPYTGPVVAMWNAASIRERGTLVEGEWNGVHETFYLEGQLEQRETYRDGVLHGPFESYFRKGMLSDRGTYENGRLEGDYESYWSRPQGMPMHAHHMPDGEMMEGELAERGRFHEGRPCGEWYRFLPSSSYGLRTDASTTYPPCPTEGSD